MLMDAQLAQRRLLDLASTYPEVKVATYSVDISGWVSDFLILSKKAEIYISSKHTQEELLRKVPNQHHKHKFYTFRSSHAKIYCFRSNNKYRAIIGSMNFVVTDWLEACYEIASSREAMELWNGFDAIRETATLVDFNNIKKTTGIEFPLEHSDYNSQIVVRKEYKELRNEIVERLEKDNMAPPDKVFMLSILNRWLNKGLMLSEKQLIRATAILSGTSRSQVKGHFDLDDICREWEHD
jgi:hypothetical protein